MRFLLPALIPLACLSACSGAPGRPAQANATPTAASASAIPTPTIAAAVLGTPTAAELSALRAEGPPALARLLAQYEQLSSDATRARLADVIDRVAGQRYATLSRLYWYTDLAAAQAAARAQGKPILSLRMLGRLDEDLSCANSRMFRTILYPDARVSALLRDRFILHWSSERPVPRVVIDYGDGRSLETTVTGNSAHYVLDADGHVLDVLPGLYAPAVFRAELDRAADLAARVRDLPLAQQAAQVATFHRDAIGDLATRWQAIRTQPILDNNPRPPSKAEVDGALALAQRATVSKAAIEVPLLRRFDLGADPGQLPEDVDVRAVTAARMFGLEPMHSIRKGRGAPGIQGGLLDAPTRALVTSLLPPLEPAARDAALITLDRTIAADTLLDETVLRRAIRDHLLAQLDAGQLPTFAPVNAWIYADVFLTPATDPWLGMLPGTYTGLPGGAIVRDLARN